MSTKHVETGSIFWFRSEGQGNEEQDEHPWIVVSSPEFHRKAELVLAVPTTSKDMGYAFDVPLLDSDIRIWPNVVHPLSEKRPSRIAKAGKVRHFDLNRVEPVVGMLVNRQTLIRIHSAIQTALGR